VLENEQEALTPGQFVNVSLVLQTLAGAVVVPAEAIQQGQEGSFIYVVQADKSVQPKAVTVAASQGRRVAVSGGVAAGDTVVTDGQLRLTPGAKIEAAAEPAAGAAAATPATPITPTAAKG